MLVGRESERRAISDLLAAARVGTSGVLVVTGEAGIGKTRLLEEAAALAASMRVLRARGLEPEQPVPFGGLLQVLRPVLGLLDHIPVPQARALASALLLDGGEEVLGNRFAVGAATLSLLSRAAEDLPTAVLVDDAHLLDQPSAEALLFAARRLISDPVAVLVTTRPGEPGSALWASLPQLTLTGLDLPATQELLSLRGQSVTTEDAARAHRVTAGNPLALLEVGTEVDRLAVRPVDLPVTIPEQLTRFFLARVGTLTGDARTALLVAAADSASLTEIDDACRWLGLEGAHLAEAVEAGLVSIDGDRVQFRHPLVRSAVYGAADATTRRSVHRAFAHVVPQHETDRLAWHLSESAVAPDETTAATLAAVGRQAASRGAFGIAADAHERASELAANRAWQVEELALAGEAAWLAGRTDRSRDLLDRALRRRPTPLLRARIEECRGEVETRSGSLDDALATLLRASHDVQDLDPVTAVRLLSDAVHVCFYLADPAAALRASATIEALLMRTDDAHAAFLGSMATGMALVLAGAGDEGIHRLRDAVLMLAEGRYDAAADHLRPRHPVIGTLWLREAGRGRELMGDAVAELREQAALGTLPSLLMHIARDDATTDRWGDAEAGYLESIRLATETGQTTDLAVSSAGLAWLYARQGREQDCRLHADEVAEVCESRHIRLGTAWLEFALGDLESGMGNPDGAVRHYERLTALLEARGLMDPDQSPAPELAEAYLQVARRQDAAHVVEAFGPKAEQKGQPWSLARLERATGLCCPDREFEPHFRTALELHARTPDRYETARTELAYGARLRRLRRRVDARPHLRSALTAFESLGATPWADAAARELEATGESVHRRESSPLEELTPQERQISRLLVEGRTTRETAAALFISPKTVEYHLRHVYLKLGIRSRQALAEALGASWGNPRDPAP